MKIRYIIIFLLYFSSVAVFANNYNADIYEDDGSSYPTESSSGSKSYSPVKLKNSQFPKIEGRVLTELYVNIFDESKEKIQAGESLSNTYLYAESLLKLRLTEGFFIETQWFFEPTGDRLYTGDEYAENQDYIVGNSLDSDFYGKENHVKRRVQLWSYGLGVETLNIGYKNSNLAVAVGKINPTFATAFDKSRFTGIYGITMPEEYELTEKIGGYIAALLPIGNITFNLFFDDSTSLSDTMFKDRGRDKSSGGAGNTDKLNNFSLTYDARFNNLSFNVGFRYLAVELEEEKTEKAFVTGIEYLIEFSNNFSFLPFAEYVYLDNFDGMASRNVSYFTIFLPLIFENWHFIFSNTTKYDNERYYKTYTSYLTQLSLGYKFDFGLMLDVAKVWGRYAKKADGFTELSKGEKWEKHTDSWAFMVSYLFNF